jgi:hypothetical protein
MRIRFCLEWDFVSTTAPKNMNYLTVDTKKGYIFTFKTNSSTDNSLNQF